MGFCYNKNMKNIIFSLSCAVVTALFAGVANAAAPFAPQGDTRVQQPVVQQDVKVGGFWRAEYRKLVVKWLPHCIKQMEKGGRGEELLNIVAAAELNAGKKPSRKFKGCCFSDAYPFNTAEAICLALEIDPGNDAEWQKAHAYLKAKLEEWIPLFLAAQQPSGYLHSYHLLRGYKHFTRPGDHEFYVMGYFIEMAVAHIRYTRGKDRRLFDAAKRLADHLDSIFGPAPKRTWYNGHAGIELAFLRLADACETWDGAGTGVKYAKLAQFFVRHQHLGGSNNAYNQTERPAVEMKEATGHAVRACYFYSAMAGIGSRLGDAELAAASDTIFSNAIDKKEYITGGVGANLHGEAFGPDYWLPLGGYCEACAACGMSFWCVERHTAGRGARTEDVRERLLYNAVLGAISNDGENFLYRNPPNGRERHYPWHGCPCCIGNIPRALFALKDTMYSFARDGKTLYVDHFVDAESDIVLNGKTYHAKMTTAYPDSGRVTLTLAPRPDFAVTVRFPDRAESPLYTVTPAVEHGYRTLAPLSETSAQATYMWTLPMPYQTVVADERVEACRGRKAYQRGPTVYSWEGPFGDLCVPNRDRFQNSGFSAVWKGSSKLAGAFAFRTWNSIAEYRDFEVTAPDGRVLMKGFPDLAKCTRARDGQWTLKDGILHQANPKSPQTCLYFGDRTAWQDCTVKFKARRLGGLEGFVFHVRDESEGRNVMINIGGWNNTQHAIEVHGYACYAKEVVTRPGKLETGTWYDIEITCSGNTVGVKMNGQELFAPTPIPTGDFL